MAMTFADIASRWPWRPIPHCPGRFILAAGLSRLSPSELALGHPDVTEHLVPTAKDPVLVARFDDGGLISYRKAGGMYLHTLNSQDGFERKLQQLGIR